MSAGVRMSGPVPAPVPLGGYLGVGLLRGVGVQGLAMLFSAT